MTLNAGASSLNGISGSGEPEAIKTTMHIAASEYDVQLRWTVDGRQIDVDKRRQVCWRRLKGGSLDPTISHAFEERPRVHYKASRIALPDRVDQRRSIPA